MKFNTFVKGIEILNLFLEKREYLTANQISEALGMPRSTTFKYLSILKDHDFLENDGNSGKYRLGLRFLNFAWLVQFQNSLLDLALPYLERISKQTKETALISVLSNGIPYCLGVSQLGSGIIYAVNPGTQLPRSGGSSTKVLIAFMNKYDLDNYISNTDFIRYTEKSILDPNSFKKELIKIQQEGYAYSDEEVTYGARGIAVPIFNINSKVIAGLGLVGPTYRINGKRINEIKDLLLKYALDISNRFCHLNKVGSPENL